MMSHTLAAQSNGVEQAAAPSPAFHAREVPPEAAAAVAADVAAAVCKAPSDGSSLVLPSCKAAVARDETGGDASLGLIGRPSAKRCNIVRKAAIECVEKIQRSVN
jgi:hypothetical protein